MSVTTDASLEQATAWLSPHHKCLLDVPIAARHRDLLDLAAAIDPAAAVWIEGMSRVPEVLSRAPAER